jgi:hypothetical protein
MVLILYLTLQDGGIIAIFDGISEEKEDNGAAEFPCFYGAVSKWYPFFL